MSQSPCFVWLIMSFALAGSACSGAVQRPVSATATTTCPAATLQSAADFARYASCDRVTGDLRIQHSTLSSLEQLAQLRSVAGTLEISGNSELDDLQGLEQLTSVGALEIRDNAELDSLTGLDQLRSVSSIDISDNAELENLEGLGGVERVHSLTIERNGLYDTLGLDRLTEVGELTIKNNRKLISLRGFKGLARAQHIEIQHNPLLAAYYGLFPELEQVSQLVLDHNAGLSPSQVQGVLNRVARPSAPSLVVTRQAEREASLR